MEVRGSVTDRPWGLTLGAIALRRHTGQLTIDSDGKRYCIAFEDGAVVAATSPQAADAIARIALTNHFITSTQVPDITRRLAMSPDRDEVEVLADAIRFTPDQALKLRHRLVAQRAARTFSLERGEFVLDDLIALPTYPGVAVDHRHVIYLGVRTNLAEQRLVDDLRQLGAYFVLKAEVIDELPRYGFEPAAHTVLEALKLGTSLPELEASHREVDPRFAQAIIYALVSCTACVIPLRTGQPAAPATPARTLPTHDATPRLMRRGVHPGPPGHGERESRPTAPRPAAVHDAPPAPSDDQPAGTPPPPAAAPAAPRSPTRPASGARDATATLTARTASGSPTAYSSAAAHDTGTNTPAALRSRTASDTRPPPPATARAASMATGPAPAQTRAETDENARFPEVPTASPLPGTAKRPGAAVFGDPQPTRAASASSPPTRPALSRVPTPNDSELRGFGDQRTPSAPGFPEQNTPGFGEQTTPAGQRPPTDPARPRTPTGSPLPSRVTTDNAAAAEESFRRGEFAMKRDQPGEAILEFKTACDLNPNEVDYAAMLAWAKFCAAGNKAAIGADTRKALERAIFKSNKPERARFYLGRVERMLGRDKEALRHFQEVLDLKPNHADAASEVRAIEARMQSSGKTGLFGRKR
jgi:uncharacterized protein DUF4388/tetratricopeptide repeat protein